MTRLSIAFGAMVLMAPMAFAQTTAPAPSAPMPPAATAPTVTTTPSGSIYYTGKDAVRASTLIGSGVFNSANERIGDVNELILNDKGQVSAVVVGVGGFLGMGEHEVAINYSNLRFEHDASAVTRRGALVVKVDATKESLKAAPKWQAPAEAR